MSKEFDEITEGDPILLFWDHRRQWLIDADRARQFHTHRGIVRLADVIGKRYGDRVQSSLGLDFFLLRPATCDLIDHVTRSTQIMYPKDIGFIILKLGLCSGKTVIEAGTGSGAMTLAMANAIKPDGHVYSYDVRERFLESAKRTLKRHRLDQYVTLRLHDVKKGFAQSHVDAALVDLGEPWAVVPNAWEALLGGAPIATFSPTTNQVEQTVMALRDGFVNIQTYECLLREIRAEKGKTRPSTMMIGHTGYATFANKMNRDS